MPERDHTGKGCEAGIRLVELVHDFGNIEHGKGDGGTTTATAASHCRFETHNPTASAMDTTTASVTAAGDSTSTPSTFSSSDSS